MSPNKQLATVNFTAKRKKLSSFLLKMGWVLMFVGIPLGSGIGAFPFLFMGRALKRKFRMEKDVIFLLINIFPILSLASIINAQNRLFALGSIVALVLMLYLVFLGARYVLSRRELLNKLVKVFILCSAISSIYGLIIYFGGIEERAKAVLSGENGLGTLMIPAVIGTLAFFNHTSARQKVIAGGIFPILLLGLLFSLSRGAWMGAIGGLIVYGIYQKKEWLRVSILIAIIIIMLFACPPLFSRLNSIPDLSYSSNQERIYILEATWKMIKDYPLTGVGMGNYPLVYPEYKIPESRIFNASFAHNIFFQIWAEAGIGALLIFAVIIILLLVKGSRMARCRDSFLKVTGAATLASFVGILIHNQVDCTIYSLHIGPLFFLLAGIIFYGEKLCRTQNEKKF